MTTNQTGAKAWAVGLAGLTCIGVAGAVIVKTNSAANAEETPQTVESNYTVEQLDAYKSELDAQAERLQKYEEKLVRLAEKLSVVASKGGKTAATDMPKATSRVPSSVAPPPIVKPAPAPAPDANSKSSG